MKEKEYVPNNVYTFTVSIDDKFNVNISVPVNPDAVKKYIHHNPKDCFDLNQDEDEVQRQYFTQERIDELKESLIKKIMETKNPFHIYCCDMDGDLNYTEEDLFDLK